MTVETELVSPAVAPTRASSSDDGWKPRDVARQSGAAVVRGKFLYVDERKFWVRGVTYGTFRPGPDGHQFPERERVERDFEQMVQAGLNSVRVYTPPPRWLLDVAHEHGLKVMVGLPWEQHIAFLDEKGRADDIIRRIEGDVERIGSHPALLCYAIGNEIPASVVRWAGPRRIERFLYRLYRAVKRRDPDVLVTYVNFPTTEYLRLPFLDLFCFNVYLETREKLEAYLARLQNIAGDKPLLMAEIGLDSLRNGEDKQAESLAWQVQTTFAAGCIGAFAFAWTDEWYRGGHDIEDWDFGLTTRDRVPKKALAAVSHAFAEVPFPATMQWPRVSVVVCSYNGARTIRDALEGLKHLEYPDFEVIVVDDGSTDETARIASEYDVTLISTENRGLSAARNTGWQTATGEIVAYLDDDAYPDPHWLHYLAYRYSTGDWVGVGGPNIAPAGDGFIADCVSNSPGGPVHVLVSDTVAEHIPGCNCSFRRSALEAVGGFDVRYRAAGDDVDLCWRLEDNGGRIGFHAGGMVWHHRRNSFKTYWRQQKGYGKAEALLEEKWPARYNAVGHLTWMGRLYGNGFSQAILRRSRIYQGTWGTAAYQSLYSREPGALMSLPLMPEWNFAIATLALCTALGVIWPPLALVAGPLLAFAVFAPVAQAIAAARRAEFPSERPLARAFGKRVLTAIMHLAQPMARLIGRLKHGLSPWRRRGSAPSRIPTSQQRAVWSEEWRAPEHWAAHFESELTSLGSVVLRGGDFDDWDFRIRGGMFGSAQCTMMIEDHGGAKQLVRFRMEPWARGSFPAVSFVCALLAVQAMAAKAVIPAIVLGAIAMLLISLTIRSCAFAAGAWHAAVERVGRSAHAVVR